MAIDALVLPLLNVPLFQGLKPLQLTEIARRADRIVYKPGDVIVTAHAETDAAVLVVSGEAVRTEGPGLEAGSGEAIPAGALISEMTMLIETECTSTVVAKTPVRALRITRSEMLAHMTADPTLADHFIEKISGRLSSFVEGLRDIDRSLAEISGTPVLAAADAAASQAASAVALH
ncbi:MAG: cyclic nucleotide-binding domain-containing protein [Hyphomicrobium zavarzinii]|jgi:CRP-like cAMP-binding protein|uniref:Crp/Fnr family transcriptional regulator n=1 Tax=Hyphomicrobium TaxID=81 RepID=UPI00036C71ED|nr:MULTISPECIES: cyclic nucleotide-binding domain-containing protein [Hyphomicrobium]MBL8846478.1 cyclic nucleotide-binding domain-containing protein [Hyphomicrobium zavarzinii]WBT38661.1 cyclic nucleotide-binding domain-containing protein [Hyphomicrobium sp. DMF-1]HML42478.1 cyclic nucleotide-binding domain-containing protein [Hyphomicrobium zavarzinii]